MKDSYIILKEKQQKEINDLPIYWAFGDKQLEELKQKLNIKNDDELKEKCCAICGGIAFKKDIDKILDTFKRLDEEMHEAYKNDEFLQKAFEYELLNHEYVITYEIEATLTALGITQKEYTEDERIRKIAKKAIQKYLKEMEKLGW